MTWPSPITNSDINSTNVSAPTSNPASAETDISNMVAMVNLLKATINTIINNGAPIAPILSNHFIVGPDIPNTGTWLANRVGIGTSAAELGGSYWNVSASSPTASFTLAANAGGGFSLSTGRFVAPATGIYDFSLLAQLISASSFSGQYFAEVCIAVNNAPFHDNTIPPGNPMRGVYASWVTTTGATSQIVNLSTTVALTAGDVVSIYTLASVAGGSVQIWSFSGKQVR